nr:MAG: ORF1 [Torque teno midi virus]
MAFWWYRRNRWYNPYYRTTRRRRRRIRKPRRRFWRRRYTRTTRRRRRRRKTKVKRKKPFLKLLQWQPDSIRKCKIIGIDCLLRGANGKQFRNFTTALNEWTAAKTPGGGGFSTAVFKLSFLYEQYTLYKNIWTASNTNYDLCRFTGSTFYFYRHTYMDFVVTYTRQYPMTLNFQDYLNTHPYRMLLQKHKIIIPSLKWKPKGKKYVKKKFKAPKQMTNKWFFQDGFAEKPLILFRAAVCDLTTPFLGPSGENELTSLWCINIHDTYTQGNWGITEYKPYATFNKQEVTYFPKNSSTPTTMQLSGNHVNYEGGWFSKNLLQSSGIQFTNKVTPIYQARYNPKTDNGIGNKVYLCSIQSSDYHIPSSDKVLLVTEKPIWLALFGFSDYVKQLKYPAETLAIYYLAIESKHIVAHPSGQLKTLHIPIDYSFILGKGPYNTTVPDRMITKWYPTLEHQQESMNNIVKTGPFIPKPDPTKANWELHYKYIFYFKWGGAQDNIKQVADPAKKTDYPTPDNFQPTIQITNPQTQVPENILHTWDFRRSMVTKTALKRMSEYLPMEQLISTDSECHSPHKIIKLSTQLPNLQEEETENQTCLQELFKEDSCQEEETQTEDPIRKLIIQQQQQQHSIKLNLLHLLTKLKKAQRQMQLQAGLLE